MILLVVMFELFSSKQNKQVRFFKNVRKKEDNSVTII